MSPFPRHLMAALSVVLAAAQAVQAQRNPPHVGYVYPAGGRQGDTVHVTVGGQYLNATSVYVSGTEVSATILKQERQLTPKEQEELRKKLNAIQEKRKQGQRLTPEEMKSADEIRQKLANFGRRLTNPSLGEFVALQVSVTPTAPLGNREIRLETPAGLSNPVVFNVGALPELSKKDWKNVPQAKFSMDPAIDPRPPEQDIALPITLNGQIPPGGVDRYRFQARKGQRLVVVVSARELMPYLADAVPGWFQAAAAIRDSHGNELAYHDHYRFHPDPVLYCKIPENGQYVLEIHDSLYRGREDFVYRVAIGELPFVTSIFPLGGPAGTHTAVELKGCNLPVTTLSVDAADRGERVLSLCAHKGRLISNYVPFAVDTLPECLEEEPNGDPAHAQSVTLPIIVNGHIDRPGDCDIFRFEGHSGQKIVAEVDARKLDSPLDSVLRLTDADGRQLAYNDDYGDKGTGLSTHHADSLLTATLSADGTYYLYLTDAQHKGNEAYAYRLRISAPRPDFALRAVPSSINVRAGASAAITVYALRKDGFAGEIQLTLKDAPKGFSLSGGRVPANQDQTRLTLSAPPTPPDEPLALHLEGRATIRGRLIVRPAVPADDMMQAFIYHHLVPAQNLLVAVTGPERLRDPWKLLGQGSTKIPLGGTVSVRFALPRGPMLDQVQLTLRDPPAGISLQNVSLGRDSATLLLRADAVKLKLGLKGNLIIDVAVERTVNPKNAKTPGAKRLIPLGSLPAVPFEIVPQH